MVPRYGPEIIGGAETAARALAERLVSLKGWDVEVLTGCADDFVSWADVRPAGVESVNGVRVVRFASSAGRDPSFHPLSAALPLELVLAGREAAITWVFDCPVIIVRRNTHTGVLVEASYEHSFRAMLATL